jgi:hypothetical protein
MVRPTNGDQLVGDMDGVISVLRIDGTGVEESAPPSLTEIRAVPDRSRGLVTRRFDDLVPR